jgi:2-oxoglutarate/2-oxoacid ferredoxin oxidoreductase subunit alpha
LSVTTQNPTPSAPVDLTHAVIRFAGDSGDGIQLTGGQFTRTTALAGNDIATLPDYPAEIRAPAGSLFGVSGFQLQFGGSTIRTPGDKPDVLVAFNPAALQRNIDLMDQGDLVIVNKGAFTVRNLGKAGYETNPLEDGSLDRYQLIQVDMTMMTREALKESPLSSKDKTRSKNLFALGMVYWLYDRDLGPTIDWLGGKFKGKADVLEANIKVLKTGYYYAETAEVFHSQFRVPSAKIAPGTYRNVTGNMALALGVVAATRKAGIDLFLGSYPITPASDILHHLSGMRAHGVRTLQAEDEIAAACAAIGASYAGHLGMCTTSGPGLALKGEAIGLALMTELPMVIVDVQRGGPSTGLPTKVEQSDLNIALYGRNGESPLPVLAAATPADCFAMAFEAVRLTIKYRTPVVLLSDAYLANGSEPWLIPDPDTLPDIDCNFATDPEGFLRYGRDPEMLTVPWAPAGTPHLEHRIGGLEKEDGTGNVSYDPANHHKMGLYRRDKVDGMAREIPPTEILGDAAGGDLLVVGWGSTYGSITTAVEQARADGKSVSAIHVRYMSPLPPDLGDILGRYTHVLVPELNLGQFVNLIRTRYLVDAKSYAKCAGRPFAVSELIGAIDDILYGEA